MRATKPPRVFSRPSLRSLPFSTGGRSAGFSAGFSTAGGGTASSLGRSSSGGATTARRFFDARQMQEQGDGEDHGQNDVDDVRLLHGRATIRARLSPVSSQLSPSRPAASRSTAARSSSDGGDGPHTAASTRAVSSPRRAAGTSALALDARRGARAASWSRRRAASATGARRRGARRRRCARARARGARAHCAARRDGAACARSARRRSRARRPRRPAGRRRAPRRRSCRARRRRRRASARPTSRTTIVAAGIGRSSAASTMTPESPWSGRRSDERMPRRLSVRPGAGTGAGGARSRRARRPTARTRRQRRSRAANPASATNSVSTGETT